MEEDAFFLELKRLSMEMDDIIEKYNMRERVISVMVTGLIDQNIFGESRLKCMYSYSLESQEELDNIINFIDSTWYSPTDKKEGYKDIDDLLDGTGIELED
jgi:phage/plasmid-associated DNA primase